MAKTSADYAREYAQRRKKEAEEAAKYGYQSSYNAGPSGYKKPPTIQSQGEMMDERDQMKDAWEKAGKPISGSGSSSRDDDYSPPKTTTTTTPQPSSNSSLEKYIEMLEDKQRAQEEAIRRQQEAEEAKRRAAIEQGVGTLNAQKSLLDQQYQSAAQQAYIQMMQSRKTLPQAMAAQGWNGGLAESSLVDLDAGYGNSLNTLLQQKNQSYADIDRDIANLKANGDISIADAAAEYARKYQELAQQAVSQQAAAMQKYNVPGEVQSKSPLSVSQAEKAYSNGIRTSNVINILKAAYGDEWEPEPYYSDKAKAWVAKADENMLMNSTYFPDSPNPQKQLIEAVLLAYKQNELSREDALAIASHYGFGLDI